MKKIFIVVCVICITAFWCTAQIVPANTGSEMTRAEARDVLDFHNKSRREVGSPPLEWSVELSAYAQEWANYLASKNNCKMAHRSNMGKQTRSAGENLFWGSASTFTPLDACQSWYGEIKSYRYRPVTAQNYYNTGHYTQMVWKKTKVVGMGVAICKGGAILIVANYYPPGNYIGEKPY